MDLVLKINSATGCMGRYGSFFGVPVAGLHLIEYWLLSEFKYVLIFFSKV